MHFNYHLSRIGEFMEELGQEIFTLQQKPLQVEIKGDRSQVTNGDYHAHNRLKAFLDRYYPYPIISEEQINPPSLPNGTFWIIDPIDGTSHYLKGEKDYAIMLALVHEGEAVMSFIYQPAYKSGYYAEFGKGSFRFETGGKGVPISVDKKTSLSKRIFQISSIKHYSREYDWFHKVNLCNYHAKGGIGIKLGAIAQGDAHYYLNFDRPLKAWDVMPSVLLAEEAGAWVSSSRGDRLIYDESRYTIRDGLYVGPDQALLPYLKKTASVDH